MNNDNNDKFKQWMASQSTTPKDKKGFFNFNTQDKGLFNTEEYTKKYTHEQISRILDRKIERLNKITREKQFQQINDSFNTIWEPKIQPRFICYIKDEKENVIVPTYIVKKANRPVGKKINNDIVWEPIKLEIYDPIVPSGAQAVWNWIDSESYSKINITLNVLGPVGDKVEEWKFLNVKIQSVDFKTLDWSNNNDLLIINVIASFNKVELIY
jgi:hypothetical protein